MKVRHGTWANHRSVLRWLLLALSLVSLQVGATTWTKDTGWKLEPGNDGVWQVLPGSGGSIKPANIACASGSCTASGTGNLPFRPKPPFTPGSPFSKPGIAAGAAGLAGRLLPWVAVGTALYDWLKDANLRPNADGSGFENMDGSQFPVGPTVYYAGGSQTSEAWGKWSDSAAVAQRIVAETKTMWGPNYTVTMQSMPAYNVAGPEASKGAFCVKTNANGSETCGYKTAWYVAKGTISQTACAYTDSHQLSGLNATGGLCPQGTPVAVAPAAVQTKLESTPITDTNLGRVLRQVWDAGGSVQDSGTTSLTGPSRVTGNTSTTTNTTSNGTQQVTSTTTYYDITYNQNTINVNETKVTTNPDGSTTQQTEPKEPTDQCERYPDSAACAELGDPGNGELPTDTKNITFTPVVFAGGGSCPEPVGFTALGHTHEFSFQPTCDFASTWVRGVVLLIGAFMASWVFIQGLKS